MINIFRIIKGVETTVCRVADSNASVVNEIMGREEITVNTTVESPLPVEVGDYVRLDGTVYTLNREPDFEKTSDVEYHYNLLFESPLYRLLDKLFTNPLTGVSKFSVARTLAEFVRFITENMNKIDSGWAVSKDIPASEPKNLSFEAASCRDVLNMLSSEFSAEYFLDGKIICFKERIENKTNLVFEQGKGKGLYSISQEPVDSENTVTRIYPYGSTQNMLPGKGDVNGRLFLPEGYLENFSEYNKVVEKEVEFNDVYPRFTGVVDTVSGQDNLVLKCASVNFDVAAQAIGGVPVKINFLSGNLMGESFEFGWDNPTKTITLKLKEDENAQADKDGKKPLIPHALKKVVAGDSFNFTDLKMPETPYLTSAIAELRAKATDWLAYYSRSRVKFTLQVDHRYLRGKRVLRAGDLITIRFPETGVDKLLRIVSTERSLSTGKITCTVSNYLDEKWEKKIEGAISSLKSSASSSTAGGLTINIIKEEDITPASDRNVYSALRSSGEFLNKTHADTATAPLTFARGLTATDGILTDTLNVTDRATVASLEVAGTAVAEVLNVSVEATAASLGVTGNTATGSLNVSGNTTSTSLDVANNISAGSLEVSSLAKAGSIDVEDLARTKMLQVSGLAKAGNIEVANNAKTKDLEVSELARIRDLVVTRLAEVLNLSVTDTATLAKTIVKESIGTGTFIPGFTGEGFKIWKLAAGWNLEIDTLTIRKTLTAFELLISKIRSVNGALAITQGNGKIKNVLDQTTVYAIEIEDTMSFVSGDLVRCQTWQSAGSKYYWVTVTRVEGNSIICNKSEFNGIVPAAGDELVQMGNVSNTARQSMIYLDASSGRPSIDVLSGINTKSFDNKLKVRLGCLDGITDTDFPSNMQPSGDGIYCTNGFFKGMFVLRSGKTVEDYTGEAVDAIQIGGVNLMDNSAIERHGPIGSEGAEYLKIFDPTAVFDRLGVGTYTFSFDAKSAIEGSMQFYSTPGVKDNFKYIFKTVNGADVSYNGFYGAPFNITTEYKRYSFVIEIVESNIEALISSISLYGVYGSGKVPYVKNIKLEQGNKATAWNPSPGDVDAAIKDAQDAADTAQEDANTAKTIADTATTRLNNWAADGTISPVEKLALKQEQKALTDEKTQIVADAVKYVVSSTVYVTAFTNYNAELTYHTTATPENIVIRASFAGNQTAYYAAKQAVLNAIATAAKKLATDAQAGADRANGAITDINTELLSIPGKITAAVTSEIGKIEIGGRNYISQNPQATTGDTGGSIFLNFTAGIGTEAHKLTNSTGRGWYRWPIASGGVLKKARWYTVSFWWKHTAGLVLNMRIEINDTVAGHIYEDVVENAWKYFEGSVYVNNYIGIWGFVDFEALGCNWFDLLISDLKLEEGNQATAWTPAPEDSAAALEVVRTELDTRLTITEKGIEQKASKEEFNALGQRVGTAEASIKTQADKIALTVTKEEFNNLQIGTKNLILNSKNTAGWTGNASKYNIANFEQSQYTEVGKKYTLVLNYINTVGEGRVGVWLNGVSYFGDFPLSTTPVTKKMTFTADRIGTVTLYHRPAGSSGTSTVYWAMLFEGDKAPDIWQAAPEDTDAVISKQEARIALTEKKIALTVTENDIKAGIEIVPGGMKVFGENHDFSGKFTFSSFSEETQSIINGKATPTDVKNAVDNYNNTIIEGGHIKTGLIEGAALNFTKGTIGGFNIAADSLYAGGMYPDSGIEMKRIPGGGQFLVNRGIKDYCMLYNYASDSWGLHGVAGGVEVFRLGSHNRIAGWNFDNEALYTGVKAAPEAFSPGGVTLRSNGSFLSKNFMITANGDVFGNDCTFNNGRFTGNLNIEGNVNASIGLSSGGSYVRLGLSSIGMFDSAFMAIRDTSKSNIGLFITNQTNDQFSLDCRAITSYGNHRFFGNSKESFLVKGPSNFMQILFGGIIEQTGAFSKVYMWWNPDLFAFVNPFISSRKTSTGTYLITHSLGHSEYVVLVVPLNATIYGIGQVYGCCVEHTNTSFTIRTADDASPNDCSFSFFVIDLRPMKM